MAQLLKTIDSVKYSEDTIKGDLVTTSDSDLSFILAPLSGTSYSHLWMGPLVDVPVNSKMKADFIETYSDGGYVNTAMEYFVTDVSENIIIGDIGKSSFEMAIDGLNFSVTIPLDGVFSGITSGVTSTTLYGSYMKTPLYDRKSTNGPCAASILDTLSSEESSKVTTEIGKGLEVSKGVNPESNSYYNSGIVYLFSDDIKKPNIPSGTTASTNSWSTGFGEDSPYTLNRKFPFNFVDDTVNGYYVDQPVGAVDLLGGIITIFNENLVEAFDFSVSTGGTSTTGATFPVSLASTVFKSLDVEQTLNMTLIAGKNEFITSDNPTWNSVTCDGKIYVTSVDIFDETGTLVAKGVPETPLEKLKGTMLVIDTKLTF